MNLDALPTIRLLIAGALMLLYPAAATGQGFVNITASAGVGAPPNILGTLGRGVCCGDFDGDGDQDLVVPGGGGLPVYYYRNDGGNLFTDRSVASQLGMSIDPKCLVAADVDNDGDLDIFVANHFAADQLFINDGTGVFTEEGALRGIASPYASFSGSFGDYDRDGWLDLYVGGRSSLSGGGEHNRLFRNMGNGFFSDVALAAGVDNLGFTLCAPFVDYDQDGWPDIFVANDKGSSVLNPPSTLYRNNGNGTFTDVGAAVGAQLAIDGMGTDYADVFNRGEVDIYVTDLPPDHHFLVWNTATQSFTDEVATYGLLGGGVGWACAFFDYDNDGWLDLYVIHSTGANRMYHSPGTGLGGGTWPDTAVNLGLDMAGPPYNAPYQFTSVVADFDDDGRLDLYHVLPGQGNVLTRNQVPSGNWLKVVTRGVVSNKDGIGARITVTVGATKRTRWVSSGTGYLTGNDMRCNFGLGAATQVDRLHILWPSGQEQLLTGLSVNQIVTVKEPTLSLQAPPFLGSAPLLDLRIQGDGGLTYAVVLTTGTSPGIPLLDGRTIPANVDWLMQLGLQFDVPVNHTGTLPGGDEIQLTLPLPNAPSLLGFTFHAVGLTVDVTLPELIRHIVQPLQVTLL